MIPLASAVAAAAPVKLTGVSLGSVPAWLTLAAIIAGLISIRLKQGPLIRKTISDRANALEDERRGDMDAMRGDIRELRKMVTDAVTTAQAAETRSAILRSVVSMLTAEIQRTDPSNPVLRQAQSMIADASMGDLGLGKGMLDIAKKVAELP